MVGFHASADELMAVANNSKSTKDDLEFALRVAARRLSDLEERNKLAEPIIDAIENMVDRRLESAQC